MIAKRRPPIILHDKHGTPYRLLSKREARAKIFKAAADALRRPAKEKRRRRG